MYFVSKGFSHELYFKLEVLQGCSRKGGEIGKKIKSTFVWKLRALFLYLIYLLNLSQYMWQNCEWLLIWIIFIILYNSTIYMYLLMLNEFSSNFLCIFPPFPPRPYLFGAGCFSIKAPWWVPVQSRMPNPFAVLSKNNCFIVCFQLHDLITDRCTKLPDK